MVTAFILSGPVATAISSGRKDTQQDVPADRQEPHNINPNRLALTRRQDISALDRNMKTQAGMPELRCKKGLRQECLSSRGG
jgi:hypothetical protein